MKNIFSKLIILLFVSLFFSCSKELEYGSNFEFKINNIDNNSIVLNTEKTFELKLTEFFNQNNNKKFQLSYECDNVSLINDNLTLLKGVNYEFTFNELSTLTLILIAPQKGDFTLKIKLKDINGLQKEQQVIVKVVEDMNFSLVQEQPKDIYENVLSTAFNFSFNLKNMGSSGDSYKIKVIPSLTGKILLNSAPILANQLISASLGNISLVFTPEMLGKQTLTVVVLNSKNLEKEITINLVINQKPFAVVASNDFEVSQTSNKQFSVVTNGTNPIWTYQVKFKSTIQAKIYSNLGVIIPLDSYVNLPTNSSVFNFIYESEVVGVDPLEISIKDKNGQIVVKKIIVSVLSKPTINLFAKVRIVAAGVSPNIHDSLLCEYIFNDVKSYGTGVTITDYEFKIFNYKTNKMDTYTDSKNSSLYPSTPEYYVYKKERDPQRERIRNYYLNQSFTARVKDSNGVWSETISGTMSY